MSNKYNEKQRFDEPLRLPRHCFCPRRMQSPTPAKIRVFV